MKHLQPDSMVSKAVNAVCLAAQTHPLFSRTDVRRAVNPIVENKDQCTRIIHELHKRGYLQNVVLITDKARQRVEAGV